MNTETKICNCCGKELPFNDTVFAYKSKNGKKRLGSVCKKCKSDKFKKYYAEKMNDADYASNRNNQIRTAIKKHIDKVKETKAKEPPKIKLTKLYLNECVITGNTFISKRRKAKYSKDGWRILNNEKVKLKARETGISNGNTKRICKYCNSEFVVSFGYYTFCSDECKRKQRRLSPSYRIRKVVEKNNIHKVNVTKVHERDKWTCKLCGVKTPKELKGSYEDNAPELDHIVPISRGGSHSYSNVQTLCRKCNGEKSDKLIGQIVLCL